MSSHLSLRIQPTGTPGPWGADTHQHTASPFPHQQMQGWTLSPHTSAPPRAQPRPSTSAARKRSCPLLLTSRMPLSALPSPSSHLPSPLYPLEPGPLRPSTLPTPSPSRPSAPLPPHIPCPPWGQAACPPFRSARHKLLSGPVTVPELQAPPSPPRETSPSGKPPPYSRARGAARSPRGGGGASRSARLASRRTARLRLRRCPASDGAGLAEWLLM